MQDCLSVLFEAQGLSDSSSLGRSRRLLRFPGEEEQQTHPGADCRIGNVECGKSDFRAAPLVQVKPEKIDDMIPKKPVYQISNDSAED
jgi:hypothetical protein